MSYELSKNIQATVTYYDVLNWPMTGFEVWKHLISQERQEHQNGVCQVPSRLADVIACLRSEHLTHKIEEQNGFYFLPERAELIPKRIQAEKLSALKLKRMKALARLLAYVPYVRMIGATGSLAMKKGSTGSDWDMFVVLQAGKMWIGRTLLTGFLHIIGKRRHGEKINDRACLNYFVTDDNLEIGTKDLFSAHEYRFLIPLVGLPVYRKFELKNTWIREYKPNFFPTTLPQVWSAQESPRARRIKQLLEQFFNLFQLEERLSRWQKGKIERNPKTKMEGSLIEASDRALIFLPHPRGPQVFEKFKERLSA